MIQIEELNLDGDVNGNISFGHNNKVDKKQMPDGLHIDATITPRADQSDASPKPTATETSNPEASQTFNGSNGETLHSSNKRVFALGGINSEFTMMEPDEVKVVGCTECAFVMYEPKSVTAVGCDNCNFTILTADPEQIIVDDRNNQQTTFTYLNLAGDTAWTTTAKKPDNSPEGFVVRDAPNVGKIVVTEGIKPGSNVVLGDDQTWENGKQVK